MEDFSASMYESPAVVEGHTAMATETQAPDKSNTNTEPRGLFKLPVELRDIIYHLAYHRDEPYKIKLRKSWRAAEHARMRAAPRNFTLGQFPESELSALLVSKRYFDEAAKAFFRSRTWECDSRISDFLTRDSTGKEPYVEHIAKMSITGVFLEVHWTTIVQYCPRLKSLRIELRPKWSAGLVPRKNPLTEALGPTDFVQIIYTEEMLVLEHLSELTFVPASGSYRTAQQVTLWHQCVRDFEAFIKQEMRKAKPERLLGYYVPGKSDYIDPTKPAMPSILDTLYETGRASSSSTRLALGDGSRRRPTTASAPLAALADTDIPSTKAEFIQLFFSRPGDVYEWAKEKAQQEG